MDRANKPVLWLYRKLLRLYPASYRQEYEDEMVDTMQAMLGEAADASDKRKLLWLAFRDYLVSLTRLNAAAIGDATAQTPSYIVRSSKFGTVLVVPFFIICVYNLWSQYILHRGAAYANLEAKTWIIYTIVLPVIAGLVICFAGARSLFETIRSHQNSQFGWLLLGVPFVLLITIVLL